MKNYAITLSIFLSFVLKAQEIPEDAQQVIKSIYTEASSAAGVPVASPYLYGDWSASKRLRSVKSGGPLYQGNDVVCWSRYSVACNR